MIKNIRFGVNYTPREKWWYSWGDWDKSSIEEDLHAISLMGMDHVRIFPLWTAFQPNENYVSEKALAKLKDFMDMAYQYKLDVQLAVLTGFLSGFFFMPSWKKQRNLFTDAGMVAAEKLLFQTLADTVGNHPGFMGFDLGNEVNVLYGKDDACEINESDHWQTEMLAFCDEIAPGKLNVNGVGAMPWLRNFAFSRERLANTGSATILHPYVYFSGASKLFRPLETGCLHLNEFLIELAKAYSNENNRHVWIQETGVSKHWMLEECILEHVEKSIRNASECEHLFAITWWCSHDIDSNFLGFQKVEHDLGLLDCQNRLKPIGELVCGIIREFSDNPPQALKRPVAIVLPEELHAQSPKYPLPDMPMELPVWNLGVPFMDMIKEGIRPSIVRECMMNDNEYLRSRGIEELIHIKK